MTTKRLPAAALVAVLLAVLAAGCSLEGGADKAGGSNAPTILRLGAADDADQPDARFVRYFASRVSELSEGSVRVRVDWDAAGQQDAEYEARLARMVRDDRLDLGWIGSRAWHRLGITSFQALQAPFLVTDHALAGRIATGPLGARMLGALDGHGFVGLALAPDRLRYPFGARRPLASPSDFAGARVRVFPSPATEALIRALGAKPVHVSGDDVSAAVANGEIDGAEAALGTNSGDEGENHLTANLPFFAKTLTLFAGSEAYERLDDDELAVLRKAARQTAAYAAEHPLSESKLMRDFCNTGRPVSAVAAPRDDLAALRRAAQPVYTQLEADGETKALIAAIRDLKARTPAPPTATPPTDCKHDAPTSRGRAVPPSTLNGTYRWRLSSEGARRVGLPPKYAREDIGSVMTMTLRDGKWLLGEDEFYSGNVTIRGNRLILHWPQAGSTNTFSFKRRPGGDLDVKPVPPMDRGDQFVMGSEPWRRVGPPVRAVP
jgi:TRAP-type C4-dicarboxylate transport system substrate-binding protein